MEALTWGAIIIAGGSIVAVITFWMNLGSRLTSAEVRSEAAQVVAAAAMSKCEMLNQAIGDYRVAMAKEIAIVKTLSEVNTSALTAAENRLAKAMEDVGDRLDHFNDRVDRLLEQRGKD